MSPRAPQEGQSRAAAATEVAETWTGLHSLRPAPGSRRPRKRVGRGEGSGTGKTSGRGQKGAGSRSGAKSRGPLRGRPDADPHADAQAARPAHEEVDAFRDVPHAHPAGQHLRPGGALRGRRRGHARTECRLTGLVPARASPSRFWPRATRQGPHRPCPRLQRRRSRAHRGRWRHLPVIETSQCRGSRYIASRPDDPLATGRHALDDPQRLPVAGHPQEARLHGGCC